MNDARSFERFVADHVAGEPGTVPLPDDFFDEMYSIASSTRQRPEWLALIKEPPMRTNNHIAVGSPAVRVVMIMATTLLLALVLAAAGAGARQLLAADAPIVVAEDGSGEHTTISAAVEAADDGDTILVRPGTYVESVLIEKDLTLRGDGGREEIILSAPDEGPTATVREDGAVDVGYALRLVGSNANVSGLTFAGEHSRILVVGGDPTIEGLVLDGVGTLGDPLDTGGSISISGGSTATVARNRISGGASIMAFDGSPAHVLSNELRDTFGIFGGFGDGSVIANNEIIEPVSTGIRLEQRANVEIRDNTIVDPNQWGIVLTFGPGTEETMVTVSGNTVIGALGAALSTAGVDGLEVTGNMFEGNGTAIAWNASHGIIADNVIGPGGAGIVISEGAPVVERNSIEGQTGRGLVVGASTSPTLRDNQSCGNNENFFLDPTATPLLEGGNEFCQDGLAT